MQAILKNHSTEHMQKDFISLSQLIKRKTSQIKINRLLFFKMTVKEEPACQLAVQIRSSIDESKDFSLQSKILILAKIIGLTRKK